jgi:hypothetical protein
LRFSKKKACYAEKRQAGFTWDWLGIGRLRGDRATMGFQDAQECGRRAVSRHPGRRAGATPNLLRAP